MAGRFAIIVAGGTGTRIQSTMPKQFLPLGGLPMLAHSLRAFYSFDPDIRLLLVLPEQHIATWQALSQEFKLDVLYQVIHGGEERFYSVRNALHTIHDEHGLVAVHDAARPFVSVELIERCYQKAAELSSAIPSLPLKDSIRVQQEGNWRPADRTHYRSVQTPQVFDLHALKKAYHQPYNPLFTDDATVYELAGYPVHLLEGEDKNWKVTTAQDLEYAQYLFDSGKLNLK